MVENREPSEGDKRIAADIDGFVVFVCLIFLFVILMY